MTFNLFITKHLYQSSISHIVSRDATAFLTSESRSDTYLLLHSTPLIFCRILNLHTTETLHQNRQTDFGSTGKFFSEALILASTNPQYDKRLFMELPCKILAQNMFCTCSFNGNSMNNLYVILWVS